MTADNPNSVSEERNEAVGNKNDGIRLSVDLRGKDWKKGFFSSLTMFVMGVLILAVGIYAKSTTGIVIGAISTAMFGYFSYLLASPSQHVSMQMVKGEMSYKQLQEAIAAERFERPLPLMSGTGKSPRFLISENWLVLSDRGGNPVYIPRTKIRSIEVRNDLLDVGDDESWDGQKHQVPYCYFRFHCDEKHVFECGSVKPGNLNRIINVLGRYFPLGEAQIHTEESDR